jgi:hypothetical protein
MEVLAISSIPLLFLMFLAGVLEAGEWTLMDHQWQNSPLVGLLPLHVQIFVHQSSRDRLSLIQISLHPQPPHASVVEYFSKRQGLMKFESSPQVDLFRLFHITFNWLEVMPQKTL